MLKDAEPPIILMSLMAIVQEFLTISFGEAREQRDRVEKAMVEWAKSSFETLSPDEISRLLEESDPDDPDKSQSYLPRKK